MLYFIIPAYNEEANLPLIVSNIRRISKYLEQESLVVLVNDGSTDHTVEVANQLKQTIPIILINQPQNLGPGRAFKVGFEEALKRASDSDRLVTIEADNTSDLCILNRMLEQLDRGNDIVLASVYGKGKIVGAKLYRRFLSFCANQLLKVVFRIRGVHTFSSFFRMYRVSAVRKAFEIYGAGFIEEPGFVCMVEILVKFHRLGLKIAEVPTLLDANIRLGDSKMKIVTNIIGYLRLIWGYLFLGKLRPPGGMESTRKSFPVQSSD